MRNTLHELAKFASGLVLGDFLCLWWLGLHNGFPFTFLGMTFTDAVIGPGLVFDLVLLAALIHYGWRIGKTPVVKERTFLLVAGTVFCVVAVAHLFRVFTGSDLIVFGWDVPVWLSWIGTAAAAYLSYMSFHLAFSR